MKYIFSMKGKFLTKQGQPVDIYIVHRNRIRSSWTIIVSRFYSCTLGRPMGGGYIEESNIIFIFSFRILFIYLIIRRYSTYDVRYALKFMVYEGKFYIFIKASNCENGWGKFIVFQ